MAATSFRTDLLIDAAGLTEHLGDPNLAVVDIRGSISPTFPDGRLRTRV